MTIPTTTDDLIAEIEAELQNAFDKGLTAYVDPKDGLTLIRHIRHLEGWKASQLKVMSPVLDYAQGLQIAALGTSCTKALIDDHKRLRELEEAQRTQPASNPYLPHVVDALDHCEHTIHRLQADLPMSNRIYKYMNSARVQADRALKNYRRVEP